MSKITFRVETPPSSYDGYGNEEKRKVIVACDSEGYSVPGDSTYHIVEKVSSTGKHVGYTITTTRGRELSPKTKLSAAITAVKRDAQQQFGRLSNPSPPKSKWIPTKAVRFNKDGSVSMRGSRLKGKGIIRKPSGKGPHYSF
jgi:hypothetical protein